MQATFFHLFVSVAAPTCNDPGRGLGSVDSRMCRHESAPGTLRYLGSRELSFEYPASIERFTTSFDRISRSARN
jgi:hypothetical protein